MPNRRDTAHLHTTPPVLLVNLAGSTGALLRLRAHAHALGWVEGRDFVDSTPRGAVIVHDLPPVPRTVVAGLGPGMLPEAMLRLLRERLPEHTRVVTIAAGASQAPADHIVELDALHDAARRRDVAAGVVAALQSAHTAKHAGA